MPEVQVPDAPQQLAEHRAIEPSPGLIAAASGVGTEQDVGEVGAGLQKYSDALAQRAVQIAAVNNKVAADNAATSTWDQQQKVILDWQANNRGMNAEASLPDLYTKLENIRTQNGQSLAAPIARADFDQNTRRSQATLLGTARGYAVEQRTQHLQQSFVSNQETFSSQAIAAGYGSPGWDDAMASGLKASENGAAPGMFGWSPEEVDAHKREFVGRVAGQAVADAVKGGDFTKGQAIFDKYKEGMSYQGVSTALDALHSGVLAKNVDDISTALENGQTPPPPSTLGGASSFSPASFFHSFVAPHEGSATVTDSNGAPVQYGINKADNPDLPVGHLSEAQAAQVFREKYARTDLPPAMSAIYSDTAFMSGRGEADKLLSQAGGDPGKFLELRSQFQSNLAASNPAKYGKYADAWEKRTEDLKQYVSTLGGGDQTATPSIAPFSEPAPVFSPGTDPTIWKESYIKWGTDMANYYGQQFPSYRGQYLSATRAYAERQAQDYTAQRTDAFGHVSLQSATDPTITTWEQLPPAQTQWLSDSEKKSLQVEINQARAGSGGYKSVEQQNAALDAEGQAITDPRGFAANPEKWLQDPDLSFSDRNKYATMAANLGNKNSKESERASEWDTYYRASPLIHNLYSFVGQQQRDANSAAPVGASVRSVPETQARFASAFMWGLENGNWKRDATGRVSPEDADKLARSLMIIHRNPDNPHNLPNYMVLTAQGQPAGQNSGVFPQQVIPGAPNAGQ